MIVTAFLAASAHAAMCAEDTVAAVEEAIVALHGAYDQVDEASFDRATKLLDVAVSCLDTVPGPSTVARLHQAEALASFVSGRSKACRRSLAAARNIDPGWKLSEEDFVEGHPYRDLWAAATDPGPVQEIGKIDPGTWVVDGYPRDEAPIERAFLLQVRDRDQAVVWSGYLWDFEEIPDRGQNAPVSTDPPRVLTLSILGVGRAYVANQRADVPHGWSDQQSAGVGGGIAGVARFTPLSLLGIEAGLASVTPDDALASAGFGPESHGAVLLGSAFAVGKEQMNAAARLGVGSDTFRVWPDGPTAALSRSYTVVSASLGLEVGIRARKHEVLLAADYLLARGTVPYQLRTRLHGAFAVSDQVAVQGGLGLHQGGLGLVDGSGASIGRRSDLDARLTAGAAVWF